MGVCDSAANNGNLDEEIKPQIESMDYPLHPLKSLLIISKSICKIIVSSNKLASGFFLLLYKNEEPFFCLITNEHVVTKKMIEDKDTIEVYFNIETNILDIKLNSEERIIKNFTEFGMDTTVIEILPSDKIPKYYFLLPLKDYMENYDKLIDKKITIIQYPKGELKYSHGKIIGMVKTTKYGFIYNADTDEGSSGSPIFLEGTTKVIGIHKGGNEKTKKNHGDLIWPIVDFFQTYSDNKFELASLNLLFIYQENTVNDINVNNEAEDNKNNSNNNKLNQMTIIYKIPKKKDSLRVFGDNFVNNNKNNCYFLLNGEKRNLDKFLRLNPEQKNNNIFKIKLIETKKITDMSYMFFGCGLLEALPDISEWDTKNVTKLDNIFNHCKSLKELSDISKWDTMNVKYMNGMFSECYSLKYLPDISKWDTKNVKYMNGMFFKCCLLKYLPDISIWDTKNVKNMSCMFNCCCALKILPDISKWNIQNVEDISVMFSQCRSLKSLPDISKWEIKEVTNISFMFNECHSLNSLPDISKWEIKDVTNLSYMFNECSSLESLPDISKWNTKNVTNMRSMFYNCCSLKSLPDISKWNTKNVTDMNYMLSYCKSLTYLPNISNWDTKNVTDMSNMFLGCTSLISLPDIFKWKLNKNLKNENMFPELFKNYYEKFKK